MSLCLGQDTNLDYISFVTPQFQNQSAKWIIFLQIISSYVYYEVIVLSGNGLTSSEVLNIEL